jgi:hypothetical protein
MSIIREVVKYNQTDINIKIPIGITDGFSGYQQEIEKLTSFSATNLVNPENDIEVRRFKYYTTTNSTMQFQFYNGSNYSTNFTYAGFASAEINPSNGKITNSFFILDFYDSFDPYNQNKIFSTYQTKLVTGTSKTANYKIITSQFYNFYVPINYINSFTGTTVIGYSKFSFYNAKTGKIQLFFNNDNSSMLLSPEKLYYKTELNLTAKTWRFITSSSPNMIAKEIPYTTNTEYSDKVNNTFDKFNSKAQDYPSGNTFNFEDGTYDIT